MSGCTNAGRSVGRAGVGAAVMALAVTLLAACSDGGSSGSTGSGTRPASSSDASKPLRVLVTNDDGFDAPGLDTVVNALRALPGVTVTVVAPATNQSGTGSKTTPGTLTASNRQTLGSYPATAVDGYPADAVSYALANVLEDPDLVVSGINAGQNVGPLAAVSGTVGAAKKAAAAGIPALAVSQGLGSPPDYPTAAKIVTGWITAHRAALARGRVPVDVLNVNVPTCVTGTLRGVKQVALAKDLGGRNINAVNCASTAQSPPDDVAAFLDGFASVTELRPDGEPVTTTTTWTSQ